MGVGWWGEAAEEVKVEDGQIRFVAFSCNETAFCSAATGNL